MAKINPNISRNPKNPVTDLDSLLKKVLEGDRFSLSHAITLIESSLPEDQVMADEMIELLGTLPGIAYRLAVSGPPGAGKSTFIEVLGFHTISLGYKPAVLAIDPSSQSTGGSILGDKMRMEKLSLSKDAFIRPSPAGEHFGGTAKKTRESVLLLEKAGFNPIIIETVGVGQTEIAAAGMSDLFLLLVAPGAGDEIQGIKRGIVELADFIVINKMDGELMSQANISLQHYSNAIRIMKGQNDQFNPNIFAVSSVLPKGIDMLWEQMEKYLERSLRSGELDKRRHRQELDWFESGIQQGLFAMIMSDPDLAGTYLACKTSVSKNELSALKATRVFFEKLDNKLKKDA